MIIQKFYTPNVVLQGLNCMKPYSSLEKSLALICRKISPMAAYPCLIVLTFSIKVNMKVVTSKFVSTTAESHPAIPDSMAVQSLQNNASVKSFHDDDIKGTSNKDSALRNKTCVVLGKIGVSDVIVDGFVSGVNLDVTQGVASFSHLNDNLSSVRRKR